jgi:hypothetical protein
MNKKIIGIFVCMLMISTAVLPNVGAKNKEDVEMNDNDETLIAYYWAFFFGSIHDKSEGTDQWHCRADQLLVICFPPMFNVLFYNDNEYVTIIKPGFGIFTGFFIWGIYRIEL